MHIVDNSMKPDIAPMIDGSKKLDVAGSVYSFKKPTVIESVEVPKRASLTGSVDSTKISHVSQSVVSSVKSDVILTPNENGREQNPNSKKGTTSTNTSLHIAAGSNGKMESPTDEQNLRKYL